MVLVAVVLQLRVQVARVLHKVQTARVLRQEVVVELPAQPEAEQRVMVRVETVAATTVAAVVLDISAAVEVEGAGVAPMQRVVVVVVHLTQQRRS